MITLQSKVHVPGVSGPQIVDFLVHCEDADYQAWWPGTHLHLRTLERRPGDAGNVVYMDEWIGKRRLRMTGVLTEVDPHKLVLQLKAIVLQPVRLVLELEDDPAGVTVTHTVHAGLAGLGRLADPLLRLYFSDDFARALDEHVKKEFPKLGALLRSPARDAA